MSPSTKPITKALYLVAGALVVWAGVIGVKRVLTGDPLAQYKTDEVIRQDAGIEADNVTVRNYENGKLVNQVVLDKMQISRDRMVTTGINARQGKVFRDGQPAFDYTAGELSWNDATKFLTVTKGIQVTTKNMNLKLPEATYDHLKGLLKSAKPVEGKFYGGDLKVAKFTYNVTKKKYWVTSVQWTGMLTAEMQEQAPLPAAKPWKFRAENMEGESENRMVYTKGEATNGEVFISADRLERVIEPTTKVETLFATGNVKYYSPEANLLCDKATIFRTERRAIAEGRVTMLIKPEQDTGLKVEPIQPMRPIVPEEIAKNRPGAPPTTNPKNDELRSTDNKRKYPVRVLAQRIEYWYAKGAKRATITGNPQARQELPDGAWRMVWAPRGEWDGESNWLRLIGAAKKQEVRMAQSNGDTLWADQLGISTERDVERFTAANVRGEGFMDEEEDLPGTGGTKPKPPASDKPLSGPITFFWRAHEQSSIANHQRYALAQADA